MFVCPECSGSVTFTSAQAFLGHFNFYHSKCITSGTLICPYSGCIRTYNKYNSFRKHVSCHKSDTQEVIAPVRSEQTDHVSTSSTYQNSSDCEPLENTDGEIGVIKTDSSSFDEALMRSVLTFIASLHNERSFTDSQIQFIIESHSQLLAGGYLSIVKQEAISLVTNANASTSSSVKDEELQSLCRKFDSCQNMYEGLSTHHLRQKEFEASGAYIKPEPYIIGPAENIRGGEGRATIDFVELKGQHIPLRHVLKGFLELPGVLKEVKSFLTYIEYTLDKPNLKMENFIQGKLWQTKIKPKFGAKFVLPLTLGFDDYEVNKDLGSHAGVHKMGAGYVSLPFLPPQFQGALENIFLAVVFHSQDRCLGNKNAFRKLLSELKFLEETGIYVVTKSGVEKIYFALALVIGDNLGANSILGFVESFSANFFCRLCFEKKNVTRKLTNLNPAKMRTPASISEDLRINNLSQTGVKEECIFNELRSFHVAVNRHVDLMHDFDEGILKYEMFSIISYFLKKRRFSVEHLNELIQGFYYGSNEEKNRPSIITHDDIMKMKRLRLSGSETRCLVRYFSLMVGHLVMEEDKEIWRQYLLLRKIIDILTAPRISVEDAHHLGNLVREHHENYMHLFNMELVPKFHMALHYESIIEDIGPLDSLSCYRIEAKHMEGKKVAKDSNNRVNVPFTIAKRHQLKLAARFLSMRGLIPKFEYSSITETNVGDLNGVAKFHHIIPTSYLDKPWNVVKWLLVNGAKYKVGSVVVSSINDCDPVFGRIKVLSIFENKEAVMILQIFQVSKFDEHFYAYLVVEGQDWIFVTLRDLVTHVPTDVRVLSNGKSYIPFRFSLNCFSS